jgi:hypothetical protein
MTAFLLGTGERRTGGLQGNAIKGRRGVKTARKNIIHEEHEEISDGNEEISDGRESIRYFAGISENRLS